MSTTLEFSVRNWQGPISLIQGVKWAGRDFFVYQADRTATGENLIIRRYDKDRNYRGYLTVRNGGHGSSTGVIQVSPTVSRHILPAGSAGIRVVEYEIGNSGTPESWTRRATGYCSAVSCNNSENRLSVRKGGSRQTVTWFDRDAILGGKTPEPEYRYSFATPRDATFQGIYNWGDSDFFHWENQHPRGSKNYRSWAERWRDGKRVAVLDTTPWQPKGEPQGFMVVGSQLYFVKRVGGLNKNRYVMAVPCNLSGVRLA